MVFGRSTRLIALAAIVTHLWVNLIVAPWHHLVDHRLPSLQSRAESESTELKSAKCSCRHHAHKGCDDADSSSPTSPAPAAPHHDADDCQVCHVLAQAFMSSEHPAQDAAPERLEFSPPESAVQPWLEPALDPVSRGPPTA